MRSIIFSMALLCLAASACAADAGSNFVLAKIDGIEGELTQKERNWENLIRVHTLSGEWTRNTANQILSKIKIEKRPQSLKFTKALDKATPDLVKRASDGASIASVQFQFYGSVPDANMIPPPGAPYFTLTLKNVTITKSTLTVDASGNAVEEITLDYEHVEMKSATGKAEFHTEK